MAAVLGRTEIGLKRTGRQVVIPDSYKGKLMFYLDCICNVLNLENDLENLPRLRDYSNCHLLTEYELDQLLFLCALIPPNDLLDKAIFANDELCGDLQNQFYELSAVQNQFVVTDTVFIGGTRRRVQKIMTFKMSFIEKNYLAPMVYYQSRLQRITSEIQQPQSDDEDSCDCCTIL